MYKMTVGYTTKDGLLKEESIYGESRTDVIGNANQFLFDHITGAEWYSISHQGKQIEKKDLLTGKGLLNR